MLRLSWKQSFWGVQELLWFYLGIFLLIKCPSGFQGSDFSRPIFARHFCQPPFAAQWKLGESLAAQCEIPPTSRRWDTPFVVGGYRTSTSHALSKGQTLRKGEGGITLNWPYWDTNNPIARNMGGMAEIVLRYRAIRGHFPKDPVIC